MSRISSADPEGPVSWPRWRSFWQSCEPRKPPPPVMMTFMGKMGERDWQTAPSRCGMHACSWTRLFQDTRSDSSGSGIWAAPWPGACTKPARKWWYGDRSDGPAEAAVALGMKRAKSLPELAREIGDGIICINLTTADVVESLVFGAAGLVEGLSRGAMIIDFGTTGVPATQKFSQRVSWLDCPVSGGQVGAEAGTLTLMAGGTEEAFQRSLPILKVVGQRATHLGPSGSGQVTKLANQLIVAQTIDAVAQALRLAELAGVDPAESARGFAGRLCREPDFTQLRWRSDGAPRFRAGRTFRVAAQGCAADLRTRRVAGIPIADAG